MRFPLGLNILVLLLSLNTSADAAESFDNRMTGQVADAATADGEPAASVPASSSSASPDESATLAEAYDEARAALEADEDCSNFFGGAQVALHVLGQLAGQLRVESNEDVEVGIQMRGDYGYVFDMKTGASFRLFARASVNRNGPFFRAVYRGKPHAREVFTPGTRVARVAMLLHELGHLIRGADGKWLLPNDGHDRSQSARNTKLVEAKCGESLKALRTRPAPTGRGGRVQ